MTIESPCIKSTRWIYPSLLDYHGLTLEYTQYPSQDRFFLNLPCSLPCSNAYEVRLQFSSGELVIEGELYEGGQRIALPESVNLHILEAVDIGEVFTIRCGRWFLEVK